MSRIARSGYLKRMDGNRRCTRYLSNLRRPFIRYTEGGLADLTDALNEHGAELSLS